MRTKRIGTGGWLRTWDAARTPFIDNNVTAVAGLLGRPP